MKLAQYHKSRRYASLGLNRKITIKILVFHNAYEEENKPHLIWDWVEFLRPNQIIIQYEFVPCKLVGRDIGIQTLHARRLLAPVTEYEKWTARSCHFKLYTSLWSQPLNIHWRINPKWLYYCMLSPALVYTYRTVGCELDTPNGYVVDCRLQITRNSIVYTNEKLNAASDTIYGVSVKYTIPAISYTWESIHAHLKWNGNWKGKSFPEQL